MASISNMSRTPHSDPLDAILERLNGTVFKVSELRLFLGDLETELNEVCKQCENEIRSRGRAAASDTKEAQLGDNATDVMTCYSQSHQFHKAAISPRPIFQRGQDPAPIRTNPEQTRGLREEDHSTSPSTISSVSSNLYGGSASRVRGVAGGILFGLVPALRSWFRTVQAQVPEVGIPISANRPLERSPIAGQISPPRPPTHAPLFPTCFSTYPAELKCEGDDWFVLFNPSPKVKRALDVDRVFTIENHDGYNCVKFSHDEKWVAFGGLGTVAIHDMKQLSGPTRILDHPKNVAVTSLCFNSDGKYLVTGAFDNKIRLWDIIKNQLLDIFEGHQRYICSLDFSSNGQFIVSGSYDGTMRIWDLHSGTCKVLTNGGNYLPFDTGQVLSVAISPDGRYVAVGGGNMVVSIWELTTGVLVQWLQGHRGHVSCVAFTPDGKGLISGSGDQTLKYWDVSGLSIGSDAQTGRSVNPSLRCIMNLTGHEDGVRSIAVSHNGAFVVSGSNDDRVLFWDMRTGVIQCMLLGHHDSVIEVALSPKGNFLATVGNDWRTRIWRYKVVE